MWKGLKIAAWLLAPVAILGYGGALIRFDWSGLARSLAGHYFLVGGGCGILFWLVARRRLQFFQVFDHELTHLIVGLLFLHRPTLFMASDRRGMVGLYGGNFIITLAPYFVPLYSLILLGFKPLLRVEFLLFYNGLLGFATGYHAITKALDFRFHQPDLRQEGRVFSLLFCLAGVILCFGLVVVFAAAGYAGMVDFLAAGGHQVESIVRTIWGIIRQ